MTDTLSPLAAFMIGLTSSGHCLGMCGGISAALAMGIPLDQHFSRRRLIYLFTYNIGRLLSYATAGALVALAGIGVATAWSGFQSGLRTLAGLLLILMGLYIGGWSSRLTLLERVGKPVWARLAPVAQKLVPVRSTGGALTAGIIWGWLPCGLVYGALGWAATQPSPGSAALIMLSFGAGTLPAMLATGLMSGNVLSILQHPTFRRVNGLLLVTYGVITLPLMSALLLPMIG